MNTIVTIQSNKFTITQETNLFLPKKFMEPQSLEGKDEPLAEYHETVL